MEVLTMRTKIKTTKKQIVDYWDTHADESDLSIDFSEADKRCWRCGCKRHLQRCHIIPDSLDGKDEPSNFVLLCSRCHLDNPNVADKEIMWDWLKSYAVPFYDTFWIDQGYEEYEKIYSISITDELKKRNIFEKSELKRFNDIFEKQCKNASYHFGDPHFNIATIAGILRMSFKEWDRN